MVYFDQHIVLPAETQSRVDRLLFLCNIIAISLSVIAVCLFVAMCLLVISGFGYVAWKRDGNVTIAAGCTCGKNGDRKRE
jgi:hypothetical protein